MEYLNRIELQGHVGTARVALAGIIRMARFTLAVSEATESPEGEPVVETTWLNVVATETGDIHDLVDITKGVALRVVGRLRQIHLPDGRSYYEVVAQEIKIIR